MPAHNECFPGPSMNNLICNEQIGVMGKQGGTCKLLDAGSKVTLGTGREDAAWLLPLKQGSNTLVPRDSLCHHPQRCKFQKHHKQRHTCPSLTCTSGVCCVLWYTCPALKLNVYPVQILQQLETQLQTGPCLALFVRLSSVQTFSSKLRYV